MRYERDERCPPEMDDKQRRRGLVILILIMLVLMPILVAISLMTADAATSNIYWRVSLHQGTSIIAYGQGTSAETAWLDCYKLQETTRAMTAAETRRNAVAAVTSASGVVRWCEGPKRYATVRPDPPPTPVGATLSWTPPTQNTNGTALTNLAGFRIHYGTTPDLAQTIQLASPSVTRHTVNLAPGTYYFAVSAYNTAGVQSDPSATISRVIR